MATRQLVQRGRQDRGHEPSAIRFTNRELAQRARQNRQRQLPQQQLLNIQLAQQQRQDRERSLKQKESPIARRPLSNRPMDGISFRHQLGHCDVSCGFCGANHWIEERVQGSAKATPRFSTCCGGGAIAMDKFEDPPQPLYSLLMDLTKCMFSFDTFADNQQVRNSVTTFGIITMPLLLVLWASKETYPFTALEVYILFAFKVNCVILSGPFFHPLERSRPSRRYTSMILILCTKHTNAWLTIRTCSMSTLSYLFKQCFRNVILISRHF